MAEISKELIQRLSEQFDAECQQRHEMGGKKYGPVRFLEVNSFQEAMNEVIDLANYARYTWMKLALMVHIDPSREQNSSGFQEVNSPVESDYPTDIDSSTSTPYNTGFFNPLRKR